MSNCPVEHLNIYLPYGLRKSGFKNTLCNCLLLSPEYIYHGWIGWWMVDELIFLLGIQPKRRDIEGKGENWKGGEKEKEKEKKREERIKKKEPKLDQVTVKANGDTNNIKWR